MPNWLLIVVLAVVFTAVMATIQGVYWAWVAKQEREQLELQRRLAGGQVNDYDETLFREEAADSVANSLGQIGERMSQTLTSADAGYGVSTLVMRMLIVGGIAGVAGGIFTRSLMGLVLALPAGATPLLFVQYQAKKRTMKLVELLPDSLELMSRSLQAGLGLNDAFRLVAEEMPMPIAAEFGRVCEEVRFGRDYREAFEKMMMRNPGVFDLRLMVSSILLQRETGGNLIEILENIASTIRSRFSFYAKVRAMTAEAKFSAIILGGLPIAVTAMLAISSPDYLKPLFNDPLGKLILLACAVSYGTGTLIMRDMTNVEV